MVDVEDIMGTSVTNVSKEILKFKVAPDSGHRQEFYIDEQPSIVHEEMDAEEVAAAGFSRRNRLGRA